MLAAPSRAIALALSLAALPACGRKGFVPVEDAAPGQDADMRVGPVEAFLDRFATGSETFVDVPVSLTFTPHDPDQAWLFLLSAQLAGGSDSTPGVEVRYLVNGVERGFASGAGSSGRVSPWQHFDVITGDGGPQLVTLQLRVAGSASTASLFNLRMIAFPVPAQADLHFADAPAEVAPLGEWETYLALPISPRAPGDYLVLALVVGTEDPSPGVLRIRFRDPEGGMWPAQEFSNDRSPWHSYFAARVQALVTTSTFAIELRGNATTPATARDLRLVAMRTDAFASFASAFDAAPVPVAGAEPAVISRLEVAAPPAPRAHVVIQSLQVYEDGAAGVPAARGLHFRVANTDPVEWVYRTDNTQQRLSFGEVRLIATDAPASYETALSSPDLVPFLAAESAIHVLGLDP
jgi:hypothetical protein